MTHTLLLIPNTAQFKKEVYNKVFLCKERCVPELKIT